MLISSQFCFLRHAFLAALVAPFAYASSGLATVDASALTPTPEVGSLVMGSSTAGIAPNGDTLTVNSQSLVLNGKPWTPISGEFHYSRYPADQWLPEMLKMKGAGVDIISTYVIWIHHEELQGQFNFTGNLDIARFIQTAAEAGMSVVARLGPWVHAEVRNGGLPDWVVEKSKSRTDDPTYLDFVTSFWTEIASRINGTLFKHGGPIVAVQLENEFHGSVRHIVTLKALAISLGFDVPLYTCTAWDSANWPRDLVVPVFGGYQDTPWDTKLEDEPPNETYSFRFFSRTAGSNGYPNNPKDDGTSPSDLAAYPFLTAEYGAGAASMYRRRCVMNLPDDITATNTVQLGSGVNLYGYYMFHGGVNPMGETESFQESTATDSYNDLPILNYDYQSPLGQYGEQRSTVNRLKQYHYWMNEFGSDLAGMSMRQPAVIPASSLDLSSLRWSVRSNGSSGYLFVNNYVRQHSMAEQTDIQFAVKFSSGVVTLPSAAIDIPSGTYFIWPLNHSLGEAQLNYATAQLMTSIDAFGQTVYIFVATTGIPTEFSFDPSTVSSVSSFAGCKNSNTARQILVTSITPGLESILRVTPKSGPAINILVLNQTLADQLWKININDQDVLVLTDQALALTANGFALTAIDSPSFNFVTFPAVKTSARTTGAGGMFTSYTMPHQLQSKPLSATATLIRAPGLAPPIVTGGQAGGALEPNETVITATQGLWKIAIPWQEIDAVDDAWLNIDYAGDLARLYGGNGNNSKLLDDSNLLDDSFYDGQTWTVGLKRLAGRAGNGDLTLAIMPLRSDAPIYLQMKPVYGANGQACNVTGLSISSVYQTEIEVGR